MLLGDFFLLHQPLGRGSVLALVVSVELAHHFVKLIHVQIVADAALWRDARLGVKERIKLGLNL